MVLLGAELAPGTYLLYLVFVSDVRQCGGASRSSSGSNPSCALLLMVLGSYLLGLNVIYNNGYTCMRMMS